MKLTIAKRTNLVMTILSQKEIKTNKKPLAIAKALATQSGRYGDGVDIDSDLANRAVVNVTDGGLLTDYVIIAEL